MQSIVVQPEVVVETTTYNGSDSASGRSTPTSKTVHGGGAITTKVSGIIFRFISVLNTRNHLMVVKSVSDFVYMNFKRSKVT